MHAKRGQMIPRGHNKWLLRVYVGRDANRRRRYVSKSFDGPASKARQALTKLLRDGDTDMLTKPSNLTFSEYLTAWYSTKLNVTPQTLHSYKYIIAQYVEPVIGKLKLTEITPLAVQQLITKLIERGLGPRTIEYAHTVLHQVLAKAIKLGFLVRNPTDDVELPAKVGRQFTILAPEQMVTLLTSEKGRRLYPVWLLMLDTGLRPGETLAIKWGDLDGDTLRLQRTLVREPNGSYQVTEQHAKTKESLRAVTLSHSALEALKAHRQQQAQEMLSYGPNYERNDFIFATSRGAFLDPNNVRNRFKAALRRAGLPANVRLYDTRHSHATALLNEGVNLAWVAARLGHSSTQVTEAVYAKVMPEAHRQMAETMEQILSKARQKEAARA
jgi:integrase